MTSENYLNSKVVKTYKICQANAKGAKGDSELFFIVLYKDQAYTIVKELVKARPELADLFTIEEEDMALELFLALLSEVLCSMIYKSSKPSLFANYLN